MIEYVREWYQTEPMGIKIITIIGLVFFTWLLWVITTTPVHYDY